MPDESPDRYHNREEDSPESLRRSIDALADAVSALDRKLDDVAMGLGADVEGARSVTRHLAGDVALMGEALVRRIENAAPAKPVPVAAGPRRGRVAIWITILALVLGVAAAAAVWLKPHEVDGRRTTPTPAAPMPPAPTPSAPTTASPPLSSADATPPIRHARRPFTGHRRPPHHPWRPPAAESPPEAPPDAL